MDRLKDYYEEHSDRFWDPREGMAGRDLDVYPLLNGAAGKVLEYGCGSGSLLLGLAREERFQECYGVDVSEKALLAVEQAWSDISTNKAKVKLMTPEHDLLPNIPGKSIDVIVSVATVEHVLDPYVVLDELHRIATDEAIFICSVPNYAYVKHTVSLFFGAQPRTGTDDPVENWRIAGWDGGHLHTFTKSSFRTLLNDCGWQPEKWTGCGERFNSLGVGILRRRFPGFMSGELIATCRKK